jgi:rod shape determining protein RodA
MTSSRSIWRQFDFVLFALTLLLTFFGILMIASSTRDAIDPDLINRVPDQIRYTIIGVAVMFVLAALDYRLLGGIHQWLYIIMVGLLLLVRAFGFEGDAGSQSWINLGFIRLQPSEIAKILIIITLGHYLAQNYHRMDSIVTVIKSGLHIAVPTALILIQPDLGMTIVFMVLWLTMIWASGLRLKHIATFMLVLAISAPITLPIAWSQMEPYQRSRITSFILPESDPDAYYNILQARISIGNGGLFGLGYTYGTQNRWRFLRVRHTDYIFAVIAEEFGFVGGMTVMGLIGAVILRILRGARIAADPLGSLICYGVASFIFFQTVVSIGMNLSLLPVTGLTLPFISSGGTSLLSTLMGVGLVESVIMRSRRVT